MKYINGGTKNISPSRKGDAYTWGVLLGWLFTSSLGKVISEYDFEEISRSWIDEWMLSKILVSTLNSLGLDVRSSWQAATLIKLLISHHSWWIKLTTHPKNSDLNPAYDVLTKIFSDNDAQIFLGVNRHQDILWFNKESYEDLLWWLDMPTSLFLPELLYRRQFGRAALPEGDMHNQPPPPSRHYRAHWKDEVWRLATAQGLCDLVSPERLQAESDPHDWNPVRWYAPLWPQMRAFALHSYSHGMLRLNVAGRDGRGMVAPGDYAAECAAVML